ncbi:GNAT family N-acetyltransferase, partial [Citrobacter freundii]|uniref:GNAT family N-acetyltransferase n=1 Tax=Citrobacter freundii TaxID=546 RepID=UPI001FFE2384
ADRNRSHWSTSKTPSYTKSVSWQHHPKYDGKIVGLVHYLFHRSTWAESNYCYLEDLFVSEDVRGQHIGKQLIEYVQQQAKKHHASRLYWHTHETNLRGQRLYDWVAKKSGMIEYRM